MRTIPIVLPSGGEAAPSGEAAPWLHWKEIVTVLRDSAYILPAASRDAASRPGRLGETQAVTTHRPNSISWVGRQGIESEGHGQGREAKHPSVGWSGALAR